MKTGEVNGCRELLAYVIFKDVFNCLRNYFLHFDYLLSVCIVYMFSMNKILNKILHDFIMF